MTSEQKEYYTKQFYTMQPDPLGFISGPVAKDYFEKSHLPVHELAKIWQLSDYNNDGLLSLEEFQIAMHLVVLKRNKINLPDTLPASLLPYQPFSNRINDPFDSDLPEHLNHKQESPVISPIRLSNSSSNRSSPSTKPTNFDFQPISPDTDHKIMHPVAIRASPLTPQEKTETLIDLDEPVRPRPTPKKTPNKSVQKLNEHRSTQVILPPPLFECSKHARSSSMDNSLSYNMSSFGQVDLSKTLPPVVPPRPVERPIADESHLNSIPIKVDSPANLKFSPVFHTAEMSKSFSENTAKDTCDSFLNGSENSKEIRSMLRSQRGRNSALQRMNSELNQELQEVMEQRIALEIQLEHLRPEFHTYS